MNRTLPLGSEIIFANYHKYIKGQSWQQAFELKDSELIYDNGNFKKGVFKVMLVMLMMDEILEINEIKLEVAAYGEFLIERDRHINEADLYGCLKFLSDKIEKHISQTMPEVGGCPVLLEQANMYEELYSFLKASQS